MNIATPTKIDRDTVYFDASCGICTAGMRRSHKLMESRGFATEPLQSPGVAKMFGLSPGEIPNEMKLRTRNGQLLGGVDAILYVCRRIWWAWPIWLISKIPGMKWILQALYRRVAANRHGLSKACRIET